MIVTFIGHSKVHYGVDAAKALMEALETNINGEDVTFYMGLNGKFDWLAKNCCLKYKKKHGNAKIIFVTPYIDEKYLNNLRFAIEGFDEVLYPDLEKVPKRYAIAARNYYMIDNADIVMHYTYHPFTNAMKFVNYASDKNKKLVDLFMLTYYPECMLPQ